MEADVDVVLCFFQRLQKAFCHIPLLKPIWYP